ncbi:cytochrome b5 [Delitschia confertaspora ATCC 74209]|uniref:Cytochrome b5 n=1 Tax=Delitschia confertaspora ATCC 74209 TaxID=1513339 RepID=A0A9P4JS91_9PLEO|nr:cytochrome b5 [Delitschia confertaspora ATCC 74209]
MAKNTTTKSTSTSSAQKPTTTSSNNASVGRLTLLDLLRVLGGMLLLSSLMSYLSTSGTSLTWGYNPWWTRAREWRSLVKGEVRLTDEQLKEYDGSVPGKPIYLALNGTIYDVSASPKTYGPGGSYHFFAGHDAARAFLTGCFAEDITPDLRGVEEMYIPKDAPSTDTPSDSEDPVVAAKRSAKAHDKRRAPLTKAQLKIRREQELRNARKQMKEGLEGWHALFRGDKGKPYHKVGEVVREEGWLERLPRRKLCKQAEESRPVRKEEE